MTKLSVSDTEEKREHCEIEQDRTIDAIEISLGYH